MTTRRSLGSALEMSPDKQAFIRGERQLTNDVNDTRPSAPPAIHRPLNALHPLSEAPQSFELPDVPFEAAQRSESARPSLLGEVLVPLTTRIRPETANALRRAYLEQKLAQRTPATQQEIIEEALTAWLRGHRFLQ